MIPEDMKEEAISWERERNGGETRKGGDGKDFRTAEQCEMENAVGESIKGWGRGGANEEESVETTA